MIVGSSQDLHGSAVWLERKRGDASVVVAHASRGASELFGNLDHTARVKGAAQTSGRRTVFRVRRAGRRYQLDRLLSLVRVELRGWVARVDLHGTAVERCSAGIGVALDLQ